MSKKIQRPISILTSITTIAWLSGIALLAPIGVGAAIIDGDIVSPDAEFTEGDITYYPYDVFIVKIVGSSTFKRLILNPEVFESYGHLEWGNIQTISASTVDGYTTSQLVRADGDTKVYKLVPDGDTGTKEWMNMTAEEFGALYDWDSIYTVNSTDVGNYAAGDDITDDDVVVSEGTLSVTLAADTPAASIAVQSAARLAYTKVNLTATGGDVIVDSLVMQRTGLAQDGAFSSVDIIDGTTNLPLNVNSKTFNSLHQSTFNDDFTVSNGTTKSVILAGNMAAALTDYTGETPSLSLVGMTLKSTATLNATLPITGNTMTVNSTITIGTATIQRGAYTNATSTAIQVGKEDYTFFSFQIQAGSAEKVQFSQIKVYQEGSASLGTDLINLELLRDGTKIADGTIVSSKYANFSFTAITLDKGQIAQFQVRGDVDDGSGRTVILGIYRTTDLLVSGLTYGYNITPTYSGTGSSSNTPVLSDNEFRISNGTLQVTKSSEIGADNIGVANDQYLGAFKFTCKGETIDISRLVLTVATTGYPAQGVNPIINAELVDPNGSVVAGPTDPNINTGVVTWTDTFSVVTGDTIYKVRGDLQTSASWASDDTVYVSFIPGNMAAIGEITGNSIQATPASSAVTGNIQTVRAASLVITRDALPTNSTIINGQSDVTLSSWTFDATASGEDVRVTSIAWAARGQAASNTGALKVYADDVAQSPINDAISGAANTSTFALTDPIIVTKGGSVTVELHGDKTSVVSDDTENWGLTHTTDSILAYGVSTGNTVLESVTESHGPTLTSAAAGTVTIKLDSASPSSKIVAAGETTEIGRIKLTASNEDIDVTQLILDIADGGVGGTITGTSDDVEMFYLYKSGESTPFASGNIQTLQTRRTFEVEKGILQVPKDTTAGLVIVVKAKFAGIGTGQTGESGTDIIVGLGGSDGIKAYGAASGALASETYTNSTSSAMILHLSKPTVSLNTLASDKLQTGAVMFDFNVANGTSEDIALYRLSFWTATSGDIYIATAYLQAMAEGETTMKTVGASTAGTYIATGYEGFTFALQTKDDSTKTKTPYVISAGSSAQFQLIAGQVSGLDLNPIGESATTFLCGDTATTTAAAIATDINADAYSANEQGNFVWSDLWSVNDTIYGSDPNATTTVAQWWNGYLVPGLQTTSTGQTLNE